MGWKVEMEEWEVGRVVENGADPVPKEASSSPKDTGYEEPSP